MRKILKNSPLFIFLVLHLSFLTALLVDNAENFYRILFLGVIALFLCFFYFKNFKKTVWQFSAEDFLLILFTTSGALLTYWLHKDFEFSIVLAAGIVGLLSSFLPFIRRKSEILRKVPPAIYCGAFAGMTAPFIAQGYSYIFLAGLCSGLILLISKSILPGYGGKLGTIAFGGVSFISFILFLIS